MTDCPYVRESVVEDIGFLAPRLRDADVREIKDVSGKTPLASLAHGYAVSDPCFTLLHPKTNEPFAMLGVVRETDGLGLIWMHCTNDLPSFSFLKHAKRVLYNIIGGKSYAYEYVGNYVDARNITHVKWLKWMGARFQDWERIGEKQIPAYPFLIKLNKEAHKNV